MRRNEATERNIMIYYVSIQDSVTEEEIEEYRLERERDLPDDEEWLSNEEIAKLLFSERLENTYYKPVVEAQ
jgi:hypothetical protein